MPIRLSGRPRLLALRTVAAIRLAPWLFEHAEPEVVVQYVAVPVHRACECEQRIADAIYSTSTEGDSE